MHFAELAKKAVVTVAAAVMAEEVVVAAEAVVVEFPSLMAKLMAERLIVLLATPVFRMEWISRL